MRQWNKRFIAGALAVFLAGSLFLTGCGKAEKKEVTTSTAQTGQPEFKPLSTTSKKVVAEYNGGKVTEGDLNLYINIVSFFNLQLAMMMSDPSMKGKENELKGEVAKQLAGQLYIANKVKDDPKFEKQADDSLKKIEDELKKMPAQGKEKAPKNLEEAIKGKGFTKDQLRTFIVQDQKVQAYSNEQLKKETYVDVKVNHILISINDKRKDADAKKRAEEVKQKLEAGGDFAKLAKEYSDDPGSKDNGGLIEGPTAGFVPEFAEAAKTLPLNKISEPVKTEYGYHVMKVTERSKEKTMDQLSDEQVKQQKIQQIFQELLDKELQFKSFLAETK